MPIFNEYPDSAPLTKKERDWCKKLEKILMSTPTRFGLATIGDPYILVFDKIECEDRGVVQEECNPQSHNLDLASISISENIQGWCG